MNMVRLEQKSLFVLDLNKAGWQDFPASQL